MNRSLFVVGICALICGIALAFSGGESRAEGAARARPKTILLGFDGVDAGLAAKWMEMGELPNLRKLASQGTFSPLGTANPAQSPVSWAVLETASNPGKTNIGDFVRRKVDPRSPVPQPALEGVRKETIPTTEVAERMPGTGRLEKFMFSLSDPSRTRTAMILFAGGTLVFVFLLFKTVFRMRVPAALVVALLFGGAAGWAIHLAASSIPDEITVPVNEMEGARFWDVLGKAGVRFAGLQVPGVFPCHAEDNVRILGGLFVPDIQGGPGSWAIYTNDEWLPPNPNGESTETGGKIFKVLENPDGSVETTLAGPENFVVRQEFDKRADELERALAEHGRSDEDRAKLADEKAELDQRRRLFSRNERNVKVPFRMVPDYARKQVELSIDGETQVVKMKEWSDYFRVTFALNRLLKVKGICRVYVDECFQDDHDVRRLKLFVPPVSISPEWQPPILPISWPRDYAASLARDIGLYDTIGWACWTNALKDSEIDEQAFMESLEFTLGWRTKQLEHELARDDWDVLFHVESVTDRAGHMLYRFIDPEHPQYDVKAKDGMPLREKDVHAYGRTFPLKHGILETYKEMDRIVGSVMDRIAQGEFGPDATLMVVSDHGFQPFRYGFNPNVWLLLNDYLVLKDKNDTGAAVNVGQLVSDGVDLSYIDWTRTRAYAIGLGKIYINLEGRETGGIVKPAEMDALVDEICGKLEQIVDVKRNGASAMSRAFSAKKIYSGPYVDGSGDIVLGFQKGYRASWQSTLGGFEKEGMENSGIVENKQPWSGDHCGVDPQFVKGVFFSNRKVKLPAPPDLTNVAPTICSIYGVSLPEAADGKPLEFGE